LARTRKEKPHPCRERTLADAALTEEEFLLAVAVRRWSDGGEMGPRPIAGVLVECGCDIRWRVPLAYVNRRHYACGKRMDRVE